MNDKDLEIAALQARIAELEHKIDVITNDRYITYNDCKNNVTASLKHLGYYPDDSFSASTSEELCKKSAQWKLRNHPEQLRTDNLAYNEIEVALREALVFQGYNIVYSGDGLACATQVAWAQAEYARKLLKENLELRAQLES